MARPDYKALWEQVKENHRVLDACDGHDFSRDVTAREIGMQRAIGKRWECTRCGGVVDSMAKLWYERGRVDVERFAAQDGVRKVT